MTDDTINTNNPEAPQWKRRRKWNYAGSTVGLFGFIACGVAILMGQGSEHVVGFAYASAGLFLVSSGIYAATAVMRR